MQLPSNDGGVIVPPPYLSASSIATWKQCPLRYKLSRIDKVPEGTSEALLMGSFVHEVLEHLYKQPAAERTLLNAKQISSYIWSANNWQQQVEQIVHTEQGIRQLRWNSWWCIENLWIIEDPMHIEPSGVENEVGGEIATGVVLKGFIDRYSVSENGGLKISDYKTGKAPKMKKWLEEKWYQLSIYAMLLGEELQKPIDELELIFLKEAIKFTHKPTPEDIEEVKQDIIKTHKEITEACASAEFETKVGKLCDWCSYQGICPAWVGKKRGKRW